MMKLKILNHYGNWFILLLAFLGVGFFFEIQEKKIKTSPSVIRSKKQIGTRKPNEGKNGYYTHEHDGTRHQHRKKERVGLGLAPSLFITTDAIVSEALKKKLETGLRDPALIALGFLTSNNEDLLKIAANKSAQETIVSVAFASSLTDFSKKLESSEMLIKAEPENALGYFCKADALFRNGQEKEALESMLLISDTMYFNDYSEDISIAKNQLLMDSGLTSVEMGALDNSNPMTSASLKMMNGISQILFKGQVDDSITTRLASIMLNTFDSYKENLSLNWNSNTAIQLLTLEETTLRRMPDGFEVANSVSTLERANQIALEKVRIHEKTSRVREKLNNSHHSVAEDYYAIYFDHGEKEAIYWLLGEQD